MNSCEKQEWIDNYLFGELEGEERICFEALMQADVDFRKEVNLQSMIMVGVCTYKPTAKLAKTRISKIRRFKRYVVATAAVILAFLLFKPSVENNNQQIALANNSSKPKYVEYQKVLPYIGRKFPIYLNIGYSKLLTM